MNPAPAPMEWQRVDGHLRRLRSYVLVDPTDEEMEGLSRYLAGTYDVLYLRRPDGSHAKLWGPDLTLAQFLSPTTDHLRFLILEATEDEAATIVEQSEPYRLY